MIHLMFFVCGTVEVGGINFYVTQNVIDVSEEIGATAYNS